MQSKYRGPRVLKVKNFTWFNIYTKMRRFSNSIVVICIKAKTRNK